MFNSIIYYIQILFELFYFFSFFCYYCIITRMCHCVRTQLRVIFRIRICVKHTSVNNIRLLLSNVECVFPYLTEDDQDQLERSQVLTTSTHKTNKSIILASFHCEHDVTLIEIKMDLPFAPKTNYPAQSDGDFSKPDGQCVRPKRSAIGSFHIFPSKASICAFLASTILD